ncbi:MAG: diguanylate cyclase, partial [Eubacterium sp.]
IGFLTMMIFLCAKGKRSRHSVIYLGAFLTCAGYWLTAESKLFQFIIPYPMTITNTGIFALTLLPIFSALYYYKTHSERLKKPVKIVIVIMSVFSFLIFILSCATPLIPVYILPLYLIIIGLYLLTFFVFILIENIKSGKGLSLSIYALFAVGFFSLGELIYYLSDTKSYNNSNLLTTGLLLFCVLLIIDTLKHFSKISKEALKVTNLTVLAYKDSLTGLKNRTAFIEKMDTLDLDAHQYISFGMFDVNNLKRTNDTLGHLVGDNLLIQSAKTLKSCLRKDDQLYRIGGDEFAAIICTQNYLDLKSLEKRLLKALAHENKQPLPYPLSIAYGYATYSPETDKDLYETLKRADALMYTKKRQQKVETY